MSDRRLFRVLERLTHLLQQDLRAVATEHGLALVQLEALQFLGSANRFSDTLTPLAEYLGATKGTVSQTVTALERKGLLVRVEDPVDRRIQHCRLTPAGREIAASSVPPPILRGIDGAAEALEQLLVDLLRARGGRAFGVCRTCRHFRAEGPRCGLVDEPLLAEDAALLCREHEPDQSPATTRVIPPP